MQQIQNFCKDVKTERLKRMITQEQMAKAIGISRVLYNKIEKETIKNLNLICLFKISKLLNLDLNKYINSLNMDNELQLIKNENAKKYLR